MSKIDSLYQEGNYKATLQAITALRHDFPAAVTERKRALTIWNDAMLRLCQDSIGVLDSAYQAADFHRKNAVTIKERNLWMVKADSLKARYDALCMAVRAIHRAQKKEQGHDNKTVK